MTGLRRGARLWAQQHVANPLDKLTFVVRVPPPGDALLETTGRRTGRLRVTPVCDCLEGDTFWIVGQDGRDADYVRNLEANPLVRVKGSLWRGGWRTGDGAHRRRRRSRRTRADARPRQSLAPPLPGDLRPDRPSAPDDPDRSRTGSGRGVEAGTRRAAEGVTTMPKFMPIIRPRAETVAAMSCIPFDEMLEGVGRYNDELLRAGVLLAAERLHSEWATRLPDWPGAKTEIRRITRVDEFPEDNERVAKERAWREQTGPWPTAAEANGCSQPTEQGADT
jgi:deazaflavin-dependent oxidoreductase (nitroreductase family)